MLALVFCPPADLSLLLLLLDNLDEVATTEKEVDPFCGGQQSKQTVRPPSVGNGRRGAERREMKERGGCTGGHQSRPLPVSLPFSSPILLPFALSLLLSDFNRVFVDPPSPPLFLAALSFPFLPFLPPFLLRPPPQYHHRFPLSPILALLHTRPAEELFLFSLTPLFFSFLSHLFPRRQDNKSPQRVRDGSPPLIHT